MISALKSQISMVGPRSCAAVPTPLPAATCGVPRGRLNLSPFPSLICPDFYIQGISKRFKVIQGNSKVLQKKRIVYFFPERLANVSLRLFAIGYRPGSRDFELWIGGRASRVNHKSTVANPKSALPLPKSTVDLGCEVLIWVENRSVPPPSRGGWLSFCLIITRSWRRTNRITAVTDEIIFSARVDLGCKAARRAFLHLNPPKMNIL